VGQFSDTVIEKGKLPCSTLDVGFIGAKLLGELLELSEVFLGEDVCDVSFVLSVGFVGEGCGGWRVGRLMAAAVIVDGLQGDVHRDYGSRGLGAVGAEIDEEHHGGEDDKRDDRDLVGSWFARHEGMIERWLREINCTKGLLR
jgi:hypothetical protein